MKKEIIEKIELLVEMSGTVNSFDTLNEELNALNQEIDKQKIIVRDLKKSMTDSKYLKANERIIDENIKMGLENRLSGFYEDLKDLEKAINLISLDEETLHNCIFSLETELTQLRRFLESLELKMKTLGEKDPSIYSFYESLISKTNDDILDLSHLIQTKGEEYKKITSRMEYLGNSRSSLEEKIQEEEKRLEDVRNALSNPNSYIDYRAKKTDEVAVDKYNEELENLEHKRLEILTDPAFIGHEAKELYLEDDKTSALDKIRELVTIIHSKPYMDVNFDDLNELLDDAINKRDEFANMIENKSYDGEDVSIINMRVLYLEKLKKESEEKLVALKEEIAHIDLIYVKELVQQIEQIKETRNKLIEDINNYKRVIQENNEQRTPKKKAILKSALKKKMDELENVENILHSFEQDLEKIVINSKKLEEDGISEIEGNIEIYERELADIKKKSIMNTSSKDVLAVEKDKEELKKLSDDVQNIMNRKKYTQTPKDIFDEIEVSFGTDLESEIIFQESKENNVNLEDYRIETTLEKEEIVEDPEEISIVNESTSLISDSHVDNSSNSSMTSWDQVEVVKNDAITDSFDDILETENNDELYSDDVSSYPPRNLIKRPTENRFKVIQVEPLEDTIEKQDEKAIEFLKEDDVVLSDFDDNDYISFNDLLAGDSNEN